MRVGVPGGKYWRRCDPYEMPNNGATKIAIGTGKLPRPIRAPSPNQQPINTKSSKALHG